MNEPYPEVVRVDTDIQSIVMYIIQRCEDYGIIISNADGSIEVRSIDLVDMVDVIVALFDV